MVYDDDDDDDVGAGALYAPLLGLDSRVEESCVLVYRDERGESRTLDLKGREKATIGRDASCELVFRDAHVSRRHATIELVHGQHFLRDEGSSNGTFLNGLRVSSSSVFALRERDVIEIGAARIHYVLAGEGPRTPVATSISSEGASHDFADLVKDGAAVLGDAAQRALQTQLIGAFVGVTVARGIERVLPLIASRLGVAHVAYFRDDARQGIRAFAAVPTFESAGALGSIALRAWGDGRGHILRGLAPIDADQVPETWVQAQTTLAAVPLHDGTRMRGVLAVQRHGGARLSRGDLALLAAIASRVAETMALKDVTDPGDTRT